MPPTLYMSPLSPPSRSVLITSEAIDLELELRILDLSKGENRSQEYIKLNPFHTVPTLVDDDVIITDSHAINAYLIGKYAKNDDLYPKDHAKRALVDQIMYYDAERLFNLFRNSVAPIFYRKSKDISQEQANKINENYKILESFLEQREWIAGDQVTIADFSLMTTTTALNILVPLDCIQFPNLSVWIRKVESLPWARVNEPGSQILLETIKKCTT